MSRRGRRRASARRRATQTARRTEAAGTQGAYQQELSFREEYRYVLSDLTRIGILAAVMVAALVALSFVIR
jgi:hypothetical protein